MDGHILQETTLSANSVLMLIAATAVLIKARKAGDFLPGFFIQLYGSASETKHMNMLRLVGTAC